MPASAFGVDPDVVAASEVGVAFLALDEQLLRTA